ncbi:hypothetical protein N482_10595 [Pseudoalteromonas luteoviolacea NCIMB 1942]|uniref:Uncharacterized protein n=1 Tax=Pseudoalteromonas luteoviolacea NCIMB 1942 TaxID=1365253 RepID=A0A162ABK6_9GAMM|nr:hypothetical protein N482_10595 [Pseudoalteromonas luteoviolacea NCIMB 1942]
MPFKDGVHTITADNDRELAGHEQVGYILPAHIGLGSGGQMKTRMVC